MKKIFLLLLPLCLAGITNLYAQQQQCAAPPGLKASFNSDGLYVSWTGIPGTSYRVYYTSSLNSQASSKDITNASSALIRQSLTSCQSYYVWAARLDCPVAGQMGLPSDTILVSPLPVPKFTLVRDTLVAYHWFILDSSSGIAPLTYSWNWGDGDTSDIRFASHTYASSGYYTICLTLTDTFGCSNFACDSSFYIYRMEGGSTPITVNVVNSIATSVPAVLGATQSMKLNQNPCTECEINGIENTGDIIVYDILGRIIPTQLVKTASGYQIQFQGNEQTVFIVKNSRTGQVVKGIRIAF